MIDNHSEMEHMKRVEWLYRWSRTKQPDTEEFQDFERRMLGGTKEEREGMKAQIFHLERNVPQFQYFRPMDDWQPKPPKEKEAERSPNDAGSTQKAEVQPQQSASKPLPHERKSRLTLGEIQAIKDMRANHHIPDDAKPDLPEGYE